MRAFCFITPDLHGRGFKLVVFANSLKAARDYVKSQSSSKAHRALKYAGEGEPPGDKHGWVAAKAEGG